MVKNVTEKPIAEGVCLILGAKFLSEGRKFGGKISFVFVLWGEKFLYATSTMIILWTNKVLYLNFFKNNLLKNLKKGVK